MSTERELLQAAYDMWHYQVETHPVETNGGWWLRETRRVLGIPEPVRIDPKERRGDSATPSTE